MGKIKDILLLRYHAISNIKSNKIAKLLRLFYDLKWWIIHRTVNRYHVLKLKTNPGYSDIVERMMHANFVLLEEFMEEEFDRVQWYPSNNKLEEDEKEYFETSSKVADELKFLYKWWQKRKKKECLTFEEEKEDNFMLIRLVKLREYLWT